MKNQHLLLLTFSALLWFSTIGQAQIDKTKMLNLNKPGKSRTLKVGEKAYFEYRLHASVGLWGSYEVSDSTILKMVQETAEYENPNPPTGMTGADKAVGIYVFEAKRAGAVKLTIKQLFRQKEESKSVFKVRVR